MTGITITGIKIVGNCSRHGKIMRNKFGNVYQDSEIECIDCMVEKDRGINNG